MKRVLALMLCFALPVAAQDAGVPDVPRVPITFAINPDGSRTVPEASWIQLGKDKAACDAENKKCQEIPAPLPGWILVAGGVVLFGAGAALGYVLAPKAP